MTINNFKDLQKLIKLCQSNKVKSIQVDGISLELNDMPIQYQPKRMKQIVEPGVTFPPYSVDENIQIPQMSPLSIPTDELTEDQMLMWSAQSAEPS